MLPKGAILVKPESNHFSNADNRRVVLERSQHGQLFILSKVKPRLLRFGVQCLLYSGKQTVRRGIRGCPGKNFVDDFGVNVNG